MLIISICRGGIKSRWKRAVFLARNFLRSHPHHFFNPCLSRFNYLHSASSPALTTESKTDVKSSKIYRAAKFRHFIYVSQRRARLFQTSNADTFFTRIVSLALNVARHNHQRLKFKVYLIVENVSRAISSEVPLRSHFDLVSALY